MPAILMILVNKEKWIFLSDDPANAAGGDSVTLQCGKGGVDGFGGDGDEQSAGSLGIEKQILIFGRDAGIESGAIANKGAVILQAA